MLNANKKCFTVGDKLTENIYYGISVSMKIQCIWNQEIFYCGT